MALNEKRVRENRSNWSEKSELTFKQGIRIENDDFIDNKADIIAQLAMIEKRLQGQSAWDKEALSVCFNSKFNHLLLMFHDSTILVYCLYQVLFENAEILRIGTHPDYQGRGLANKAMNELQMILQKWNVESLLLEVRADNMLAIALYRKQGLIQIDRRKNYYTQKNQPSIDALILQKQLSTKRPTF